MSTKIHNGRIVRQPIYETYELFMTLAPEVTRVQRVAQAQFLANIVVDRIDGAEFHARRNRPAETAQNGELIVTTQMSDADMAADARKEPLSHAARLLCDRQADVEKGYRDPAVDFDASVMLFPLGRVTLVMLFVENPEIAEMFDKQDWLEDYHYQDSTDGPEDVPPIMWAARQDMWEQALGPRMVPGDRGLSLQFGGTVRWRLPTSLAEVMDAMPDKEVRISRLARRLHQGDVIERMQKGTESKAALRDGTAAYQSYVHLHSIMSSPEEKDRVGHFVEIARPCVKDLTDKDVLGWTP